MEFFSDTLKRFFRPITVPVKNMTVFLKRVIESEPLQNRTCDGTVTKSLTKDPDQTQAILSTVDSKSSTIQISCF